MATEMNDCDLLVKINGGDLIVLDEAKYISPQLSDNLS